MFNPSFDGRATECVEDLLPLGPLYFSLYFSALLFPTYISLLSMLQRMHTPRKGSSIVVLGTSKPVHESNLRIHGNGHSCNTDWTLPKERAFSLAGSGVRLYSLSLNAASLSHVSHHASLSYRPLVGFTW